MKSTESGSSDWEGSSTENERILKNTMVISLDARDIQRISRDYKFLNHLYREKEDVDVYKAVRVDEPDLILGLRVLRGSTTNLKNLGRELSLMGISYCPSILRYENGSQYGNFLLLEQPYAFRLCHVIKLIVKEESPERQCGFFDQDFILRFFHDMLCALKELHSRRLVHGHLTSECVMLGLDGRFYLTGLEKCYTHSFGRLSGCKELLPCMPAEQIATSVDKEVSNYFNKHSVSALRELPHIGFSFTVDIWALGILIHEIARGESVYGSANTKMDFVRKVTTTKFRPLISYSNKDIRYGELLSIMTAKVLTRDVQERPEAAELLMSDLFDFTKGEVNRNLTKRVFADKNANFEGVYETLLKTDPGKPQKTSSKYLKHWKIEKLNKVHKKVMPGKVKMHIRVRDPVYKLIRYLKVIYDKNNPLTSEDEELASKLGELVQGGLLNHSQFLLLQAAVTKLLNTNIHYDPPTDEPNFLCREVDDVLHVIVRFGGPLDTKKLINCANIIIDRSAYGGNYDYK